MKTTLTTLRQLFLKISIAILLLIGCVFILIQLESRPYIKKTKTELPSTKTAIVLGAGLITKEKLSGIFKDRVDVAIMLYQEKKVTTILVTGDDGTLTHNEVTPAREYLLAHGIPSKDIFLDHAGFDTYSSMYRARDVFLIDEAVIITQSFHLPRSVFIARTLGINAYGLPADQHAYSVKNNFRELLANVKAILDIIYKRTPKYLGEEIPITGDSRDSI